MNKIKELKQNGWIYREINQGTNIFFEIIAPEQVELPNTLYKLFTLNENSVDSLLNNYLFGCHPSQFNDLFDCHQNLVVQDDEDHRKVLLEYIKAVCVPGSLDGLNEEEMNRRVIEGGHHLAYNTFGISCFTSDPNNVLMWAYYGNNAGFMIEFDISLFPPNFQGPFPINYQKKVISISLKENGAPLSLLYQSNVKSKSWEHECEWRYLLRAIDGKPLLPPGWYTLKSMEHHNRKFSYPIECIKSITLGNRFLIPSEIVEITSDNILKAKLNSADDLKIKIFDFCVNNQIKINYGLPNNDLMTFDFRSSRLEKKNELEYWIY